MNVFKLIAQFLLLILVGFPSTGFANRVVDQNTKSKSYVKLGLSINLRSIHNMTPLDPSGLGKNAVIQLPNGVAVVGQDGKIDLNKTVQQWLAKSKTDPNFPEQLVPKYVQAPGTNKKRFYFPVRTTVSKSGRISKGTIGYMALKFIAEEVDPSRFEAVHGPENQIINTPVSPYSPDASAHQEAPGSSEATTADTTEPAPVATQPGSQILANDCNATRYRTTSQSLYSRSCWASKSITQKAQEVINNINFINQQRQGTRFNLNLDPRYSVCTSYNESHMLPDARNGQYRGMFQVGRNETKTFVNVNKTVVPAFKGLSYDDYRTKMLNNSLAQADLHHGVIWEKARMAKLTTKINNGTATTTDYKKLARYYYYATLDGSIHAKRAATYSTKVSSCFGCLKNVYTKSGQLKSGKTNGNAESCIKRAR